MAMPKERVKEWRDEAVLDLREAIRDPATASEAVDSIIAAAVAKVNINLRSEMAQIRGLLCARPEETTHMAVRRLVSERDGLLAKYRDSRERTKEVIVDLKARIRLLEREKETRRSPRRATEGS